MTTPTTILQLATGRKVRARRAPTIRPRESKLHTAVAKLLTEHCLPDWKWRHVSGKAKRGPARGRDHEAHGRPLRAGQIFILVSPYGKSVRFSSVKRGGEVPSDAQNDLRRWCVALGVPHVVAWTIDDVLAKHSDAWGSCGLRARVK